MYTPDLMMCWQHKLTVNNTVSKRAPRRTLATPNTLMCLQVVMTQTRIRRVVCVARMHGETDCVTRRMLAWYETQHKVYRANQTV